MGGLCAGNPQLCLDIFVRKAGRLLCHKLNTLSHVGNVSNVTIQSVSNPVNSCFMSENSSANVKYESS